MAPAPTPEAATKAVFAKHAVCLVLDYGSQYTQLIARRIRDAGVLSVLLPGDASMVRGVQQGAGSSPMPLPIQIGLACMSKGMYDQMQAPSPANNARAWPCRMPSRR